MKKVRFSTTIELVLLICFMLASILFIMELYIGKYASFFYTSLIALGLMLFIIFFFVWGIHYKRFSLIRRVCLCLFTCCMLSFTVFSNLQRTKLAEIGKLKTHYLLNLVAIDSNFQTKQDFEDQKIGYIRSDQTYIFGLDDVEEELDIDDIKLIEYADFELLFKAMMNQEIQGALVGTLNYQLLLRDNQFASNHHLIQQTVYQTEMTHQMHEIDVANEPFTVLVSIMLSDESVRVADRNDLNFIVYLNPNFKTMHVQMLPSHLYVPNLAYDGYSDRLDRLGYSGMDNVLFSLESMVGFEFDYFMKLNIESYESITKALGGLDVDLDESFCMKSEACLTPLTLSLNENNIRSYLNDLKDYPETYLNLFRAFFEKRKDLNLKNDSNLLQITNDFVFTDIHSSTLAKMQSNYVDNDWTYSDEVLSTSTQVKAPCVSWDFYDLQLVSIADESLGAQIYERYLRNKDMTHMKKFAISLDQFQQGHILPRYNENVVTKKNAREKITSFYTVLPNISITPLEIEKWNDPILTEAHFDPDKKVEDIEKIEK